MSSLETFEQAFAALPEPLKSPARRAAFERFVTQGLPTRKQEQWKYTDLSRLRSLVPDLASIQNDVSLNLADNADAVDALNAAFCSGGLSLDLEPNSQTSEVLIADGEGHRRHRVRLGHGASAVLRLDTIAEAEFQTSFLDIELAAGSRLEVLRLQNATSQAQHITRIRARLERDSQLDVSTVDLGGKLSRHDLEVELAGSGASMTLRSLFLCSGKSHIDNQTRFDHRATHCTSKEHIRGLATDSARGVFNGKIVVHPGAQKTDSEQRIANLILSPKAEIDAKPELEIYADDVKCAHGATFGQLDLKALFYLRSRGLPEAEARALLTLAFAMEPLRSIPNKVFRDEVTKLVVQALGAEIDDTVLS